MVEQHRHISRSGRQITDEQCDRAGTLTERIAQRQLVAERLSIIDVAFDNFHRPVRKALHTEDRRVNVVHQHALIVDKANNMPPMIGADIADHVFDIRPGFG